METLVRATPAADSTHAHEGDDKIDGMKILRFSFEGLVRA
jgi:hypothetical protein